MLDRRADKQYEETMDKGPFHQRSNDSLFIVGDRWGSVGIDEGMLSVSEFVSGLRAGRYHAPLPTLRPGFGVDDRELEVLRRELEQHGLDPVALSGMREPDCVEIAHTHKRNPRNVLLAKLVCLDGAHYRAALRLDSNNELLLDHVTGCHISAMVMTEAARQMFLAVTEQYFLGGEADGHHRFVINDWQASFENFLFPLDAVIDYRIEEVDHDKADRLRFRVEVLVKQAGTVAARVRISFTVFDAAYLTRYEMKQAARTIRRLKAGLAHPDSTE
ncbi:AfsA-related hotdog domain-containing protein [Burkholderia paludis]|uniref:AfsA-related hotdog domain-containing protein n=1 Tax=Burkholderia paludis TaxID=1506587 RepID=UPI001F199888|nr:AfsA-related hotdog domain-containing protein [Burkholderia paludis]